MKYKELLECMKDMLEEDLDKDVVIYNELEDAYCTYTDFSRTVGDYNGIDDDHPIIIMSGICYNGENVKTI